MSETFPSTCKALICHEVGQPLKFESIPTPDAIPGSVVVRVLTSIVPGNLKDVMSGAVPFLKFPTPMIPGSRCVGRVAAIGPDTTSLPLGQLVLVEPFIRARDDPNVQILWAVHQGPSPASEKLMKDAWLNGCYADYTRVPLENCYALNEKTFLGSPAEGGLGYSVADLTYLSAQVITYGGLRSIDLKAGETIIVAPATGAVSSTAVEVASAMGARVIAMSRNLDGLQRIAKNNPRVHIVQTKGDVEEDAKALQQFGTIDAYIDISPPVNTTHVRSCLMALKQYGRASLMGVIQNDLPISYSTMVMKSLTIRGQHMYEREDVRGIIKLAESGLLKLGKSAGVDFIGEFPLEEWEQAFNLAADNNKAGKGVLFVH
ncbi:hypothetical protein MMC20_001987 [Loxospora ochrophaea]|nr:hypothetical protein [Loxospora ochrophaea]